MRVFSTKNYRSNALKFLIYGQPGAGKTTLASTINEPVLIISAESGLRSLSGKEIDAVSLEIDDAGVVVPRAQRVERLREAFRFLQDPEVMKKYKWVFIDSLSEIGDFILSGLKEKYPSEKDKFKLYGDYNDTMRSFITGVRDMPDYNVVFTALEKVEKDDVGRRYKTVNLTGSIGDNLPAYFDEVFYYHKAEGENGQQLRMLLTDGTDQYVAKDRSGVLAKIEEPNLSAIAQKIRG